MKAQKQKRINHPTFIARRYHTTEANLHKHGLNCPKDLVPVLTSPKGIHADALNIRQTTKAVDFLCEIFMNIKAMLLTVLGTAAVYLTGCATNPPVFTSQQLATAHYGQPLTIDWQAAVKGWFLKNVTDPLSAQYKFNRPPRKGYIHTPFNGTIFAYFTVVRVNAKDSSGAYIGFLPYLFIFKNNHIIKVAKPGQYNHIEGTTEADLYPLT